MISRAGFIRGLFGLAFTASVAIRGAAQDAAAGALWKRVPRVIRIPAHMPDDFFNVLPARTAASVGVCEVGSGHGKYEVIEETEEPETFDDSSVRFRITLYDKMTDSLYAERVLI